MRELYYYCEIEDMYEEMLNDCYDVVSICGINFDPGSALRELDKIAFVCGVSQWEGEEFDELTYDDLTDEEREHYCPTVRTTMYARKRV
jgi:hypothetical protein